MQRNAPRKACDLCYNKRIKCDGQKPLCSHCVIYKSECSYTAASRKTSAQKRGSSKGDGHLVSRVEHLETRLGQALESIRKLESLVTELSVSPVSLSQVRNFPKDNTGLFETRNHTSMELPPLPEVLPAVEKYLRTCNSVLPLFHSGTLLRSVHNWYRYPEQRDCVSWAAINVVLALAHRGSNPTDVFSTKTTAEYLNKAQSVLTEMMMRSASLINVQVLAGLVMLYQGAQDMGPPTMLVAIALRLAHGLGLQNRRNSEHLDASVALQRSHVFWIIYILDRDISMRIKQAPLQQDTDIDLDLPPEEPDEDNTGFVISVDGRFRLNFFRARVQLARIQGSLYDCLYSVAAQTSRSETRADNMTRIRHMLDDWSSHMPQSFSPGDLSRDCPPEMLRYFGILYGTRLSCLSLVSLAHSWDARWMEKLQEYGCRAALGDAEMPVPLPAPLPEGWETLVKESREFIKLFMSIEEKDGAFVWMTACAYISGLVCLTANNMCQPNHGMLEFDRSLADMALLHVEEMVWATSYEPLRRIGEACKALVRYDRMEFQQRQRNEIVVTGQLLSEEVLPFYFVENGAEHIFGQAEPVTILGPLYISSYTHA
ncbi:fungal-specific transcription factor domain-containing protein [Tricladium varicosporioides]|nr:fungal-specific transcription factor domain-containing protein [Hymenoscyphus varicosporioides]